MIELMISLMLVGLLMTAAAYAMNPILLAWSSHQDRMELQRGSQHGLEKALRDLRPATALQNDAGGAVRYTLRESGVSNSYILYLYHSGDGWPPAYNQSGYQLRKAPLAGGIGGAFTYGAGDLLMRDVQPPPASGLSLSGSVATMDLTLIRADESYRLLERVKRRN